MINKDQVNKIIIFRKKGFTTYKISEILKIPRPTVSRHLIKHGLGSYKLTDIQNKKLDKELLGEFLGLFAADGNAHKTVYKGGHKYRIRISFSYDEKEYAEDVRKTLHKIFKKKPFMYENKKYNVIVVGYNSKKLTEFIKLYLKWKNKKSQTVSLRHLNYPKEFLKGFLRGFLDGDGYSDNYQRVSMFCISRNMMKQIHGISKSFGFNPKFYTYNEKRLNKKNMHFVSFSGEDARNFIIFVKPRNPKRVRKWAIEHISEPK